MTDDPSSEPLAPVAAIHHDGSVDVDGLLARFVQRLRGEGRRVHGLLMSSRDPAAECRAEMVLTDIDTGTEYLVSQSLGSLSNACRADPQGFARASHVLRDALDQQPDLVVTNRFGSLEAENGGFVAELLALMERGIPVLTVVAPKHLAAWQRFIGSAPLLAPDPAAWRDWFDRVSVDRVGA